MDDRVQMARLIVLGAMGGNPVITDAVLRAMHDETPIATVAAEANIPDTTLRRNVAKARALLSKVLPGLINEPQT